MAGENGSGGAAPGSRPNLVLIGFMTTGKSTIGRLCARALGFRFRDTDVQVERWSGKTISRIFAEDGEAAFRRLESSAIRALSARSGLVIATGGGAPVDPANVARLRQGGVIVLLKASPGEIVERSSRRRTRPLLADVEDPERRVMELLEAREGAYNRAADAVVETTGLSAAESTARVLQAYRGLEKGWSAGRVAAR